MCIQPSDSQTTSEAKQVMHEEKLPPPAHPGYERAKASTTDIQAPESQLASQANQITDEDIISKVNQLVSTELHPPPVLLQARDLQLVAPLHTRELFSPGTQERVIMDKVLTYALPFFAFMGVVLCYCQLRRYFTKRLPPGGPRQYL